VSPIDRVFAEDRVWSTDSTNAIPHVEGGKGTTSKVVKFQVRLDALAK